MTAQPEEKMEVIENIKEEVAEESAVAADSNMNPIYGTDVISSLKELFPGFVEEHNMKVEKLRLQRDTELDQIQDDERYSEEFIKNESEKIGREYDSLLQTADSNHSAAIQNRIAGLESEEESIIYADDEEEVSYRSLVSEAKNGINDAVLSDDKVSRKLALETAVNLRKIAQIEEQRELTKLIRHYPLEALDKYRKSLSENNTRLINYFESVWPTVKEKSNPLAVGDREKDAAAMMGIEETFEKLRDDRRNKLNDRLGPVRTQRNLLQLYLNDLELAAVMRK